MPKEPSIFDPDSFRDSIGTINESGDRQWVYPQKQKGKFYRKRNWASNIFLLLFFGLPFIKLHGKPLILFNILEREFIIFGAIFRPQDLFLFALFLLTFMVFIVLFTVIFGRLFCGWACPQTVFMEMVFRKIEYWIEGNAQQQKALNERDWDKDKLLKKGGKIVVFFVLSFVIGNFFLSYFIGIDALIDIITQPLNQHWGGLIAMLSFAGVFFFVYSWFREQVCIVVCPYGRLQGVLLDANSIVVAYDYLRGEPRGKISKPTDPVQHGDCIDCNLCVRVCPTGIDIRNGTQLECINCTLCIDACDQIMESIHKPKGLIRYASENGIAKGQKLRLSPRMIGYSIVLLVLVTGLGFAINTRHLIDTTVLRAPGVMYQEIGADSISNLYNYKMLNKSQDTLKLHIKLLEPAGTIKFIGTEKQLNLYPGAIGEGTFFVTLHRKAIEQRKMKLQFGVFNDREEMLETIKSVFLGPI
ncbi:MAG: cytochrome c oxidase accessory protein CcoG [Saprospiraceae bacterium]